MGSDHRGQPSGEKEEGTRVKPVIPAENLQGSEEISRKYKKDENELSENLKETSPSRNTNKDDSTNAGGYRP